MSFEELRQIRRYNEDAEERERDDRLRLESQEADYTGPEREGIDVRQWRTLTRN